MSSLLFFCIAFFFVITSSYYYRNHRHYYPHPFQVQYHVELSHRRFAVVNRGFGEVLLVNSDNDNDQSILILDAVNGSEPLYVANSILTDEIWIGDRFGKRLFVYDTIRYKQRAIIETDCNGIFHQAINLINQLWVVCDEDNSILIIDTESRTIITTINIYITENGFKPHDIAVSTSYGFVSLLGENNINTGYIIQYATNSLREINRIEVGGNAHLFYDFLEIHPNHLYAASQIAGEVYKINADTLEIEAVLNVPGAHGIAALPQLLCVTNIESTDGIRGIQGIGLKDFTLRTPRDSLIPHPHNLMMNFNQRNNDGGFTLFVTHSNNGIVTAYYGNITQQDPLRISLENAHIVFHQTYSVPFGVMLIYDGYTN